MPFFSRIYTFGIAFVINNNMTPQEINNQYNGIIGSLDNKELKNAFNSLQNLIAGTKEYSFQDKLTELHETYKYMLKYSTEGVNDPMQKQIYHNLLVSAYELASDLRDKSLSLNSSLSYYSKRRTLELREITPYKELHTLLQRSHDINQMQFDESQGLLFNKIWVSAPLKQDEASSLKVLISDASLPYITACIIVSALTLALQTSFDEKKLMLLFDAANQEDEEIKVRAIIGILLTLYTYRKRIYLYPGTEERLAELAEHPGFAPLLRTIILKFILSRETEKITKKLQTEILPEMMKLSPKLNQKLNIQDLTIDSQGDEMNPEWQSKLENSGLEEKLKEFTDLQMEGADVMHSSFIHLKSYSFFHEISNWFLPFTAKHSSISGNKLFSDKDNLILESLTGSSFICNSDKYSIYFSMMNIPAEQRAMIANQFNGEAEELMQQKKEELNSKRQKSETIIGQYIQDLYRFYKIHPHHLDFDDIFTYPLDFHNMTVLKPYISDSESLTILAEYYLRKGYYQEAQVLFAELSKRTPTDAVLFQKIGFCQEMNNNYQASLDTLSHADLLESNNKWTLRHIAKIYRTLSQPEQALIYYRRLEILEPDNLSVQINIGHCLLEVKNYTEALKCFFKVDYLDSKKSHKAWRPIAWCSFVTGKYDQARNYYQKILANNPNEQDYLNAGHIEWALNNMKETLRLYVLSVQSKDGNIHKFMEQFHQDIPELLTAGVEAEDIPLLLDQLRYQLEE